jgi:two-component system response regulator HydG
MFEQELNKYWKTVVDTIRDVVMIVGTDGTIVFVNKSFAEITGYKAEEIIGKPCTALHCDICEIALDGKGDGWCVLFRTGRLDLRRSSIRRRDGKFIPILKNASLLYDMQGKVIGAVETMTDISEVVSKEAQIEQWRKALQSEDSFHGMLGSSTPMIRLFELIAGSAKSDAPVVILGETGAGKDLVAKAIHDMGVGADKPFVKVNCAALSESLLESELFGHVKGAFTGAYRDREGRFEAAGGGSIFLDEIGELPVSSQVKLLRVLEERVIERVGDNRQTPVDIRVISATNRDLETLVSNGSFREDLYYRINVVPISVPSLRERTDDIPLLAEAFLRRIRLKTDTPIRGLSKDVIHLFIEYPWPGNVRELKSALEYATVICDGPMIEVHHLPERISQGRAPLSALNLVRPDRDEPKKKRLIEALIKADGNQSEAARILGVSRGTVWNRMKKFGIDLRRRVDSGSPQ